MLLLRGASSDAPPDLITLMGRSLAPLMRYFPCECDKAALTIRLRGVT
jgi:hypothetical protein